MGGIDCPEVAKQGKPGQPFSEEATNYVKERVLNKKGKGKNSHTTISEVVEVIVVTVAALVVVGVVVVVVLIRPLIHKH